MKGLSAEQRLALGELVARYCHSVDSGRVEQFSGLFTEDGLLDLGVWGCFRGRPALAEFVASLSARRITMRHFSTNALFWHDGERVRGESYVLALVNVDGQEIRVTGRYQDEYAEVEGGWRFRVRRAYLDS